MDKNAKIYVAGHRGMVGSAIVRELLRQGYANIITRNHSELDLINQQAVNDFFAAERPEYVFLAAAKVGGIVANESALADFMYDNMMLEMNVIRMQETPLPRLVVHLSASRTAAYARGLPAHIPA